MEECKHGVPFDLAECKELRENIRQEIDAEILGDIKKIVYCTCNSTKKGILERLPTPSGGLWALPRL